VQRDLYGRALAFRESHTSFADSREEFVAALKRQDGFVVAPWCDRPECENDIKAETSAVTRVILGPADEGSACAFCGQAAKVKAYFARSY
jgi:prolyl-tRNA synthetase